MITDREALVAIPAEVDIILEVGELTEEITISAAGAELLNTTTAELATTIDEQLVDNMPVETRNYFDLLAMRSFSRQLGLSEQAPGDLPFLVQRSTTREAVDARQYRQLRELEAFTQEKIRLAEYERDDFFWSKLEPANPEDWQKATRPYRNYFWDKVIGRFPATNHPLNPRTRRLDEHSDERITTYEVLLDSRPGVYTWGYLLLPNDLQRGERRAVIVCQHGANGQPSQTLDPDGPYKAYARRLAERGFIVYAPYNPNKLMGEEFRQLQRKGNSINKTIFAVITANHQRTLQWLELQPFVDPSRIAFYGLSYGGKTAMRIPALLEKYCLSICSGDFNDHLRKVTLPRSDKHTLMFYDSYENVVFNMGNTFNYPEMAALIAPRPFMVEHGYKDRVAPLEWAAAEYSKVQKLYFYLGIPERTEMAFFDGPHMIHGEATFDFLHRQLNWKRKSD